VVDTEIPVARALVDVGLALEDGAGDVELGEGGVRWVMVLLERMGGDVPIYIFGR